ncbi:MAG: tetratricopeptide repeat protein [Rhodocyclaceae bacterium]|nr:tetratricopeptide repeat protein [Rhodocyclaceae bacterium]
MLKDLDARHAAEARKGLHREVRALPAAPAGGGWRRLFVGGAALLLAAGGGWLAYERFGSGFDTAEASAPIAAAVPAPVALPPAGEGAEGASEAPGLPPSAAVPAWPAPADMPPPVVPAAPVVPAPAVSPPAPAAPVAAPSPPARVAEPSPAPAAPATPAVAPAAPGAQPAAPAAVRAPAAAPASPVPAPTAAGVVEKRPPAKSVREQADADHQRAVALVTGGRPAEAVDLLLDVLRRDGGHVSSRQLLARLLVDLGRRDEALALLVEGLAAQPGQIQWAMSAARLLVDRGDPGAAAGILQGSLPFASANADYLGFAGYLAHRLDRHQAAVEHYRAAARIAPGDGRWWLGLGLALEAGQHAAEAREAFLRARQSGSLNADLAALVDQKLR